MQAASSRAVARVVEILQQLSLSPHPLTNREIALRIGAPASSVFRILRRLVAEEYLVFDPSTASYSISNRLGELGERIADADCRSPAMAQLVGQLRESLGFNVMVWVPSGLHVRMATLVRGVNVLGTTSAPGELRSPFTTPGLAIALHYTDARVRDLVKQCRRRAIPLGRGFATAVDVLSVLRDCRSRGYVSGYNITGDGWAMISWPIPVPVQQDPRRIGSIAIGSRMNTLRKQESRLLQVAAPLLASYRLAVQERLRRGQA